MVALVRKPVVGSGPIFSLLLLRSLEKETKKKISSPRGEEREDEEKKSLTSQCPLDVLSCIFAVVCSSRWTSNRILVHLGRVDDEVEDTRTSNPGAHSIE